MRQPAISVVIPCLNGAQYLKKALRSINKQTIDRLEIIFVDGGSSDRSTEIFSKFRFKTKFFKKIIFNKNEINICGSLHKGFNSARGKYIYQLCVDDEITDTQFLQDAEKKLLTNKLSFIWARTKVVYHQSKIHRYYPPAFLQKNLLDKFERISNIVFEISPPDNTLVIEKRILQKHFPIERKKQTLEQLFPHAYFNVKILQLNLKGEFLDKQVHTCNQYNNKTRTEKNLMLLKKSVKEVRSLKIKIIKKMINKAKLSKNLREILCLGSFLVLLYMRAHYLFKIISIILSKKYKCKLN